MGERRTIIIILIHELENNLSFVLFIPGVKFMFWEPHKIMIPT
jgi:hypothetical protein